MRERRDVLCLLFCEQDSAARRESRGKDKRPGWLGVRGGAEEPPRGCFASHRGSVCGGLLCRASLLVVLRQKLVYLNRGLPPFWVGCHGAPGEGQRIGGAAGLQVLGGNSGCSLTQRWCRAAGTIRFYSQRDIFILSF